MSSLITNPEIRISWKARTRELFDQQKLVIFKRTDRLFCGLLVFEWVASMAAALWISPRTWEGAYSETHLHVWAALFLGGIIISLPVAMGLFQPGKTATRHLIGVGQMLIGALLIHLTGGRLETHFHVFGSLAFLAFYRDWRVLISASAVVAADHFFRGLFWPQSVYGVLVASEWRWLEHAGWVVFEDMFLIRACIQAVNEMRESAERQAQLETTKEVIEAKVRKRTAELETLNKAYEKSVIEARQSEEKYRHTLNAAGDAIISIDEKGAIIEFNRAAETTFGYPRAEMIGLPVSVLVPERLRAPHQAAMDRYLQTGKRHLPTWQGLELPGLSKDRQEIPLEISFSVFEADGKKYLSAVLRDITQRKRAEAEARGVHEENQRILGSIPSIMISFDNAGRITKLNRAAEDILGTPFSEAVGKGLEDLVVRWDGNHLAQCVQDCLSGRRPTNVDNITFKRPGGQPGFLGISINPVTGPDGSLQGALLLGADITERRNLETQLAHAQKLESIGQLAAGIAHEINTPIQYVGDNVAFLRDAFADYQRVLDKQDKLLIRAKNDTVDDRIIAEVENAVASADLNYLSEEVPRAVTQTLEGIGRVAKIVLAMKEFSHPGNEGKVASNLNKLIQNTIVVAQNEWKYVAELVTDLDPSLPLVPCIAGEFNQVILNLIVNAAHAIGDRFQEDPTRKGVITISTRMAADGVEIRVKDTGTGIPEAVRSKVFYPFFTTKPVGKGTGQGLAIAHTVIVKKHGGTLTFETEIDKGTSFIIQLPGAEPKFEQSKVFEMPQLCPSLPAEAALQGNNTQAPLNPPEKALTLTV